MPIKRSAAEYGDACATAHAVELVGDRWAYPIIRELMLAPKRFRELADSVVGITPAVLTGRLREMERTGLVERATLPPPAAVPVYRLTPWARELEPALQALGRWGHRSPTRTPGGGLTPDAAVQAMLTMAPAEPPRPGLELQLDLSDARLPGEHAYRYRLSWDRDGLRIERGEHAGASASLRTDSSVLAQMLFQEHGFLPDDTTTQVEGDRADVARLIDAYAAV